MKRWLIKILVRFGWGKNFSYAQWEKYGVEDIDKDGTIYWLEKDE